MKLSTQEIEQQCLADDTLAEAVRQVREAGFVILEETMDRAWCDAMREAWDGHLEGRVPGDLLRPPFIDPLAIENPWAVQIMDVMASGRLGSARIDHAVAAHQYAGWFYRGARYARLAPGHAQPYELSPHHDVAGVPSLLPDLGLPIQGGRSAASGDYGPTIGAGAADFSLQ